MAVLVPATVYLLILSFVITKMTPILFASKSEVIRVITYVATGIFAAYLLWGVISFLRNEDGKSFTVGWFALAYFLAVAFTIFGLVLFLLRIAERRIVSRM